MLTPLILFLGLTVATAVIAHWSDNLGKKLGKKRVSLFGLRPRTTATVLTVASSWAIMLFTLVALLIVAPSLRRALLSYDRERAQAQSERQRAKIEIEAARELLESTRTQLTAASGQLGAAQTQLATANASVKRSRAAAIKAEAAGRTAEASARQRAKEARQRVVEAQKRVVNAQKRLVTAQKAEAAARRAEATAQGQARIDQRLSRKATRDLEIAGAELDVAQNQLKTTQAQVRTTQSQYEDAQNDVKTARNEFRTVKQEQLTSLADLYQTEKQLVETRRQLAEGQLLAEAFAANDAPVKIRQTFAASRISAKQRPEAIVAQLRALLEQGQELFDRGEEEAPTPNFPEGTKLQLLPTDVQDANGKLVRLQGEPLLQFLASDMRRQTTTDLISARLVAWRNHLAGEKAIDVLFVFVPIKPAFADGEILASSTIDGAQGDARIFSSLLDLTEFGQLEAKKRGVNPPQSLNEPSFYAVGTNVRIFEALRRIESSKARLSVNLVVARALTTVEPLEVRFEIEGQPTS